MLPLIQDGLNTVSGDRRRWVRGARRLGREGGYFSNAGTHAWLSEIMSRQVRRFTGKRDPIVTFADLYEATGIELNIVAADISTQRQIVFNHHRTPACQVVDAVLAASAIPLAFPAGRLWFPGHKDGETSFYHTIVDGGVWANFPMFVFEDQYFRAWEHGQHLPKLQTWSYLVGFLLDETPDASLDPHDPERIPGMPERLDQVSFLTVGTHPRERVPRATGPNDRAVPVEWHDTPDLAWPRTPVGWILWAASAVLRRLVNVLGPFLFSDDPGGRWPLPASRIQYNLTKSVDWTLRTLSKLVIGPVVTAVFTLSVFGAIAVLWGGYARLAGAGTWELLTSLSVIGIALIILPITILLLMTTLLMIVGFVLNMTLSTAVRQVGRGVIVTYAAGPGSPPWARTRPDVIALRIPDNIRTLSFDILNKDRDRLIDDARDTTLHRIAQIVGTENDLPVAVANRLIWTSNDQH